MRYLIISGFLLGWLVTDMAIPVNSEPMPACTYKSGQRVHVLTDPERCSVTSAREREQREQEAVRLER